MKTFKGIFLLVLINASMSLGLVSCAGSPASASSPTKAESVAKVSPSTSAKPKMAAEPVPDMAKPPRGAESSDEGLFEMAEVEAGPSDAPAPAAMARSESSAGSGRPGRGSESGLKAGFADDNQQYNAFTAFIRDNTPQVNAREVPYRDRIVFRVSDEQGATVPNAQVRIMAPDGSEAARGKTWADGTFDFYPDLHAYNGQKSSWTAEAIAPVGPRKIAEPRASIGFKLDGPGTVNLLLKAQRWTPNPIPLDIVFVLDTTGSMGEEIERLKTTIEIIYDNLDLALPRPKLRFGLVLYKDRGDEYVVRQYPLTENLDDFRKALSRASASGGGDEPEDLEAALESTVSKAIGWNPDGVRLAFIITDAPTQTYDGVFGYDSAVRTAREQGIKIHSVGTGGLPLEGEYQLRQIAQATRGRYIFLTYGERGESEGGTIGAVSHHSGANWNADKLEAVIIRFAKEELALMGTESIRVPDDDYFEARSVASRDKTEILDELFGETVKRLMDYASATVEPETPAAILPISLSPDNQADPELAPILKRNAEYFGMSFMQASLAARRFRLVAREDLQAILGELELSLSALGDSGSSARVGELLGAELLVTSSLIKLPPTVDGPAWELSVRLIKVRNGEILSVARARIAKELGLE